MISNVSEERRTPRRPLQLVMTLLLAAGCSSVRQPPVVRVTTETSFLSCEGRGDDSTYRSRTIRSPILTAPDGRQQAYVMVEAIALNAHEPEARSCQNVSRLRVAAGGSEFRDLFVQDPGGEGMNGNALRLVDWSPDSTQVLAELHRWLYPNQIAPPLLVIVRMADARVDGINVEEMIREKIPGQCALEIHAAGFSAEGLPVIRTSPGRNPLDGPPCAVAPTHWLVHPAERTIEELPDSWTVRRYGTWGEL
ncbi:MAG TPA: hypothetical protein VM534_09590 [Thermoanaerobaculia bacterium]|nr:hypothetical protein [Thermoanaerobaculia bacterium]